MPCLWRSKRKIQNILAIIPDNILAAKAALKCHKSKNLAVFRPEDGLLLTPDKGAAV